MAIKTEIKLLLDANAMRRVVRLPGVGAARRGRAKSRNLREVYFDTPAADLMRAGATLRMREERGCWVQTLNLDGCAAGGPREWEWHLAGPAPDFKALRGTGAARLVRDAKIRKTLVGVFHADFIRTSIALELDGGARAELRLDSGEIISGKRRAPICEIEVELLEGDRARLFDFAMGLAETLPVRVSDSSIDARRHAILLGLAAEPVKAQAPALAEGMQVPDAFGESDDGKTTVQSAVPNSKRQPEGLLMTGNMPTRNINGGANKTSGAVDIAPHSGDDVLVSAQGAGAAHFAGSYENTSISVRLARAIGGDKPTPVSAAKAKTGTVVGW
jgi:hypothetical protein